MSAWNLPLHEKKCASVNRSLQFSIPTNILHFALTTKSCRTASKSEQHDNNRNSACAVHRNQRTKANTSLPSARTERLYRSQSGSLGSQPISLNNMIQSAEKKGHHRKHSTAKHFGATVDRFAMTTTAWLNAVIHIVVKQRTIERSTAKLTLSSRPASGWAPDASRTCSSTRPCTLEARKARRPSGRISSRS